MNKILLLLQISNSTFGYTMSGSGRVIKTLKTLYNARFSNAKKEKSPGGLFWEIAMFCNPVRMVWGLALACLGGVTIISRNPLLTGVHYSLVSV